jgi:hypothetical protein
MARRSFIVNDLTEILTHWCHRRTPDDMTAPRPSTKALVTAHELHPMPPDDTSTVGVRIPPRAPRSAMRTPW